MTAKRKRRGQELDSPGPHAAAEAEIAGWGPEKESPSRVALKRLFDHQRWLATHGRAGEKLRLTQSFTAHQKDFGNLDLDGMDFSRASFKYISFILCSLKDARFAGAAGRRRFCRL